MTKIDYYCPKCGETTRQPIHSVSPGKDNFICDSCLTVWEVNVRFYDVTPKQESELRETNDQ